MGMPSAVVDTCTDAQPQGSVDTNGRDIRRASAPSPARSHTDRVERPRGRASTIVLGLARRARLPALTQRHDSTLVLRLFAFVNAAAGSFALFVFGLTDAAPALATNVRRPGRRRGPVTRAHQRRHGLGTRPTWPTPRPSSSRSASSANPSDSPSPRSPSPDWSSKASSLTALAGIPYPAWRPAPAD
jgi:hypothetical protein